MAGSSPNVNEALGGSPPFIEHHVPREQGSIYARDYGGNGPAFVLMHGFPDNLRIYGDLIPHLVAGGRRVVAFDFQGFGASDKPAAASYSFRQQLGDLEALVDGLGLGKIVPVGHDAAGPAAINFAIEHPERVASLCILNTFYAASPAIRLPELVELFATPSLKALALAIAQSPAQLAWLLQFQQKVFLDALIEDQRAHFGTFLAPIINDGFLQQPSSGPAFVRMAAQLFEEVTRNTKRLPELEALDIPVKLIWGKNDPYLGTDLAEDFRSHLKRSSLLVIPAGHWVQIDAPLQVAKEMLS
jgi:pimeloyl-ACP methyl ester carboxylesterase